jgi:hypothetical protein
LRPRFLAPVLLLAPLSAGAAEVVWDGHYRARGQYFNSLSLSSTNTNAEGAAALIDHRLRLQPGWLMSDRVGLFAQLDLLPYTLWGDEAIQFSDPALGDDPLVLTGAVRPPTTDEGGSTLQNIQVTRVFAEVHTGVGQLRFGRMPLEWGSGMLLNAGNANNQEFGDTADRIQFTGRAGQVYLQGGLESNAEQFVNEGDDVYSLTGSLLYSTEQAGVGVYNIFRRYNYDGDKFGMYTLDFWGAAEAGPLNIETEFVAQIGRGDLGDGVNDASINAFGAMIDASYALDRIRVGLGAGLATGDKDTTDDNFKTFTFDRDFNQTLFLFEEPMPTLTPTVSNANNGGRDYDAVRTGYALSNALYLRPRIGYTFSDDLTVDLSYFAAQAAALPDDEADSKGYGSEVDARVVYRPFEHFVLDGTLGVFFPGSYYSSYTHEDLGGDFDRPAIGAQLLGTVEF